MCVCRCVSGVCQVCAGVCQVCADVSVYSYVMRSHGDMSLSCASRMSLPCRCYPEPHAAALAAVLVLAGSCAHHVTPHRRLRMPRSALFTCLAASLPSCQTLYNIFFMKNIYGTDGQNRGVTSYMQILPDHTLLSNPQKCVIRKNFTCKPESHSHPFYPTDFLPTSI